MRCESHPEDDAVGICSRCGRGVCPACAVKYAGKLSCKQCIEAGSIVVAHANRGSTVALTPEVDPWPPVSDLEKWLSLVAACIPVIGVVTGTAYLHALSPHRRPLGHIRLVIGFLSLAIGFPPFLFYFFTRSTFL